MKHRSEPTNTAGREEETVMIFVHIIRATARKANRVCGRSVST